MSSRLERRLSKEATELQNAVKKIEIKDLKDINDFSLDKVELVRGQTPENIKQRCLQLCKDYIAADWEPQTVDTIEFRRLSGGMTNQLYYIGISQPSVESGVPQEVAIRLYGPKHFMNNKEGNERLTDVVIALMVSESQLGPKIHGIFEDGQIQHYYKFRYPEQKNPTLRDNLFQALARVHAMEVPIKKNSNWVFDYFDEYYVKYSMRDSENKRLFEELNCNILPNTDMKAEIDWLKKAIVAIESPIVFTHIDFRGSNIMVIEPDDRIVLCDFEYSSYGFRGFDFGTILCEWGRDLHEMTKSEKEVKKFPNDSELKQILQSYVNESEAIHGKGWSQDTKNSMQHLIKEAKIFTLASMMFIMLFCLGSDEDNGIPLDRKLWMQMGELCTEGYLYLKDLFIKQEQF